MKICLSYVPPMTFVLHRFLLSVAVLLPFFIFLRNRLPRDNETLVRMLVLCLIFVSIIALQALGLSQENSGITAVLSYTQPLFIFCLAVPTLQEQVTIAKLLGVVVGFTGVVILSLDRIYVFNIESVAILLASAFLWAVQALYYKKYLRHIDPFATQFLQLSVGVVPLLAWSLITSSLTFSFSISYVELLFYSSVGALAAGNIIYLLLLQHEEATTLSGSTLIIPTVALIIGRFILGESLNSESLLGALLTLAGICLVNLNRKVKVTPISPRL